MCLVYARICSQSRTRKTSMLSRNVPWERIAIPKPPPRASIMISRPIFVLYPKTPVCSRVKVKYVRMVRTAMTTNMAFRMSNVLPTVNGTATARSCTTNRSVGIPVRVKVKPTLETIANGHLKSHRYLEISRWSGRTKICATAGVRLTIK